MTSGSVESNMMGSVDGSITPQRVASYRRRRLVLRNRYRNRGCAPSRACSLANLDTVVDPTLDHRSLNAFDPFAFVRSPMTGMSRPV